MKVVESIFVDPLKIDRLEESGANHLIVAMDGLNHPIWDQLQQLGMTVTISFVAFDRGGCPADPKALDKLIARTDQALVYQTAEIWLDHFRFDGHWEGISGNNIPNLHTPCSFCQNKDRVQVLLNHLTKVRQHIGNRAKLCYFAVPFKTNEVPQLTDSLGQDHSVLGKIFDASSPMLYHRMIKKPVSYISNFVSWMHEQTGKPVLPIIQIKDMPDDLEDRLTEAEITQAFNEAIKPPSQGVCFFYWTHALEKNKSEIISKIFS